MQAKHLQSARMWGGSRVEYSLWQINLIVLQIYGITTLKGVEGKELTWVTLESGIFEWKS